MADGKHALKKVAAGDYLLCDGNIVWRIAKHEALGSGPRGMYGYMAWGLWRWSEVDPGAVVDTHENAWQRWTFVEGDYATRAKAIEAIPTEALS